MRWAEQGRSGTVVMLAVAGTLLYAASRTAAAALAGRGGPARPGWRAVGHWLPIAVTAFVAALREQPDVAVALTFATSVGCLSFILGVLTYLSPMEQLPASRRGWPFVLPAALLALIAGFSGHVTWVHATAMLLLGAALVSVWRDPALREAVVPAPVAGTPPAETQSPSILTTGWLRTADLVLALALAAVGGWYAVDGVVRAAGSANLFPPSTLTVVILSPLVTLPMLNPTPPEAPKADAGSAVSILVAVVLLNLCLLLPSLSLLWHAKTALAGPAGAGAPATTQVSATAPIPPVSLGAMFENSKPLPFPLPNWRVDAVVLTVLGFVMIPVSLGRWELRRAEAAGLVLGYAVYLVLVAFASIRP